MSKKTKTPSKKKTTTSKSKSKSKSKTKSGSKKKSVKSKGTSKSKSKSKSRKSSTSKKSSSKKKPVKNVQGDKPYQSANEPLFTRDFSPETKRLADQLDSPNRKKLNRKPVSPPPKDPRFEVLDKSVMENIPEGLSEKEREELIKERREEVEAIKEEIRMPSYRTLMRRVYSFKNYKPNSENGADKTDMNRLNRANYSTLNGKNEGDTTESSTKSSIIDYESPSELSWYGSISKFGKASDLIIEHLMVVGRDIEGYLSSGSSLIHLKGLLKWPAGSKPGSPNKKMTQSFNSQSLQPQNVAWPEINMEGINSKTDTKYSIYGNLYRGMLKAEIQNRPPNMVPQILEVELKTKPCTVFIEPEKRLQEGRISKTEKHILVMFTEKGQLRILSGVTNKEGVIVATLTRANENPYRLIQSHKPSKLGSKSRCYTFCEEFQKFALVVEECSE